MVLVLKFVFSVFVCVCVSVCHGIHAEVEGQLYKLFFFYHVFQDRSWVARVVQQVPPCHPEPSFRLIFGFILPVYVVSIIKYRVSGSVHF